MKTIIFTFLCILVIVESNGITNQQDFSFLQKFRETNFLSFFISEKPKACKTSAKLSHLDNPKPNQDCIFRITLYGKTYTKCTDITSSEDIFAKNVCATRTEGSNHEIVEWGICNKDCDMSQTGEISKHNALCSRNFQNVKLRLDFVKI